MFFDRFSSNYKTVIFILMMVLVLFFIGKIADIAIMFFGAFIISASVSPVIGKLQKYIPRPLAVCLVLLLVFAGILLIFIPLLSISINQISNLISTLPENLSKLQNFLEMKVMGHSLSEFINLNRLDSLSENLANYSFNILNGSFNATKALIGSFTSLLMVIIMVFYLCMDEAHMKNAYLSFFPPKFKKKAKQILDILTDKVGGYVLAQVLSMLVVGVLVFLGLLIIRHPHALFVGFLTFILDLIPVVGATISVIIGVITAWDNGIGFVMLSLAIMLAAQLIQNQVARPLLFGKFMDIHPLLIIVSLLIGAKFLGFAGVILGPAFACLVCVLVNELYIKQINNDRSN